jgi:hypothetical protein
MAASEIKSVGSGADDENVLLDLFNLELAVSPPTLRLGARSGASAADDGVVLDFFVATVGLFSTVRADHQVSAFHRFLHEEMGGFGCRNGQAARAAPGPVVLYSVQSSIRARLFTETQSQS